MYFFFFFYYLLFIRISNEYIYTVYRKNVTAQYSSLAYTFESIFARKHDAS